VQRLLEWLNTDISWRDLLSLIPLLLILGILLECIAAGMLELFGFSLPRRKPSIPMLVWAFPFQLLFLALVEELIYRAPLLLLNLAGQGRVNCSALLLAVVLSVMFGVDHGNWQNIFIQGFGGLLYCLLFFKAGGISGNFFRAITATTGMHFLHNGVIALIQLAHGASYF